MNENTNPPDDPAAKWWLGLVRKLAPLMLRGGVRRFHIEVVGRRVRYEVCPAVQASALDAGGEVCSNPESKSGKQKIESRN